MQYNLRRCYVGEKTTESFARHLRLILVLTAHQNVIYLVYCNILCKKYKAQDCLL